MTKEQARALLLKIEEMPTNTALEKARKGNALRHYNNRDKDSGAGGRIEDILSKATHSKMVNFSKQGSADCFVYVDGKRYKAERKTNGGRIGALYGKKAPRFVVYSMDICNTSTSHLRRVIPPVVMLTVDFLDMLERHNAVKNTNGNNPEAAIQASSKALYLELLTYTITYDPNKRYTSEEYPTLNPNG